MTKIRMFKNKTYCLVVEFERLKMGGKRTKTQKKENHFQFKKNG